MRWNVCQMAASIAMLCVFAVTNVVAQEDKWIKLFDGKSLDGWEKVGKDDSIWEVKDGEIRGSGQASMLVCTQGPYKNFKYRAEVKINDKGNSGLYFRTTRKPALPMATKPRSTALTPTPFAPARCMDSITSTNS